MELPEPDAMVTQTTIQPDLPEQSEVGDPNAINMHFREGIDVSHYQNDIDWPSVAKKGEVGYVFIKATEGGDLVDDTYNYNIVEARKAGLKVGSYHFFRAKIPVEDQYANMTAQVKKEQQDLIPIIDVEHTNGVRSSELVARLKKFLRLVENHYGKKPILYTFVNFYNRHFCGAGLEDYPLMIAFYRDDPPELNDGRKYCIWQYTSHGEIPGIDGNVDRSLLMEGFGYNEIRLR